MFGDDSLYPSLPNTSKLKVLQKYDGDKDSKLRKRKREAEKYLDQLYNKQITGISNTGKFKAAKIGRQDEEQQQDSNLPTKNTLQNQKQSTASFETTSKKKPKQKNKQKSNQKQQFNKQLNLDDTSDEVDRDNQKIKPEESNNENTNVKQDKKQKKKKKKAAKKELLLEENDVEKQISWSEADKEVEEKPKSKLFAKLEQQLQGGRFRWLNQQLYTINSQAALKLMQENKDYFEDYHEGFRTQTAQWPVQPINQAIDFVKRKSVDFVVADFGCGEAQLAKSVPNAKVYSIDLVSNDLKVIACDMAHTPLKEEECDIVIFCLALMGLNYGDFLLEANRVLKKRGWLWIAEVRSRFDNDKKLKAFVDGIENMGFKLMSQDLKNTHFVVLVFKKKEDKKGKLKKIQWPDLKTCLYKKR
eukprot:TRINITY_DN11089_c0_g2_i1.p1 TRINITY_DN11089_c0_g2~~TRINITY_DN11089_c0_g2_i1.p1  ORF type:complete len:440 (-),score=84.83 TRINITY_DN11089_c0_g2_i1:117-1361(-)